MWRRGASPSRRLAMTQSRAEQRQRRSSEAVACEKKKLLLVVVVVAAAAVVVVVVVVVVWWERAGAIASAPVQCSSGAGTTNSRMGFTPRPRLPRARLPDACPPGSPPLRATEGRPRACLRAKRLGGRVGSCRLRPSHRRRVGGWRGWRGGAGGAGGAERGGPRAGGGAGGPAFRRDPLRRTRSSALGAGAWGGRRRGGIGGAGEVASRRLAIAAGDDAVKGRAVAAAR